MYIYIYIPVPRAHPPSNASAPKTIYTAHACIYVYMYIYRHTYTYIYMYICLPQGITHIYLCSVFVHFLVCLHRQCYFSRHSQHLFFAKHQCSGKFLESQIFGRLLCDIGSEVDFWDFLPEFLWPCSPIRVACHHSVPSACVCVSEKGRERESERARERERKSER